MRSIKSLKIGKRNIGDKYPCYVVAELSGNHNGKLKNVFYLIDKAKKAGVDAVKIQAYEADTITINSSRKDFRIKKNNSWSKYDTLYKLYKKAQTPLRWLPKIFKYCKKKKINVFASVFDVKSLKILKRLNCPAYKIASPEITDIPLLEEVAKTGKPIIISTGLSDLKDLNLAYKSISKFNKKIIILKCTSAYPSKIGELNLKTIIDLKKRFKCLAGFSDHTIGIQMSILAAAIGSNVIEKHFIAKKTKSVDSFFSLNDKKFKEMITNIRNNEIALGKINYNISKSSKENLNGRRSLYVVKKIKKNEKITHCNVRSIRPSFGLHPVYLKKIIGKKSKKNLEVGDRLSLSHIES